MTESEGKASNCYFCHCHTCAPDRSVDREEDLSLPASIETRMKWDARNVRQAEHNHDSQTMSMDYFFFHRVFIRDLRQWPNFKLIRLHHENKVSYEAITIYLVERQHWNACYQQQGKIFEYEVFAFLHSIEFWQVNVIASWRPPPLDSSFS